MAKESANQEEVSKDISRRGFDADDLRSIASFDDAIRLLQDQGVTLEDATQVIGDGFTMLEDKNKLVDSPSAILTWLFTPGDYGQDFVVMRIVTQAGDKYVVTDGGTGICRQLREYEARSGRTAGLLLPRGLRRSQYPIDKDGMPVSPGDPAAAGTGTTYYLNV